MAITDRNLIFGEDVSVTAGGLFGDVIDLQAYNEEAAALIRGEPFWWVTTVTQVPTGGHSLHFDLFTDSDEQVANGDVLIRSRDFPRAELTDGFYYSVAFPITSIEVKRYLGMVNVPFSNFTGLKMSSYLTTSPPAPGWGAVGEWR